MAFKKGYRHSEGIKEKIRINHPRFWKGKKRSKETRKKISDSLKQWTEYFQNRVRGMI